MATQTVDPTQIPDASQIPPAGALYLGLSSQGLVDIYCGTLPGDLDAPQPAKELLSNADYIYRQISALYGPGAELPDFRSPSGKNVKSLVFVSGSSQGGYGAFHFPGTQADFDRIVVDSLNTSGSYSAGSGLGFAIPPAARHNPRLFEAYRGPRDLSASPLDCRSQCFRSQGCVRGATSVGAGQGDSALAAPWLLEGAACPGTDQC